MLDNFKGCIPNKPSPGHSCSSTAPLRCTSLTTNCPETERLLKSPCHHKESAFLSALRGKGQKDDAELSCFCEFILILLMDGGLGSWSTSAGIFLFILPGEGYDNFSENLGLVNQIRPWKITPKWPDVPRYCVSLFICLFTGRET